MINREIVTFYLVDERADLLNGAEFDLEFHSKILLKYNSNKFKQFIREPHHNRYGNDRKQCCDADTSCAERRI